LLLREKALIISGVKGLVFIFLTVVIGFFLTQRLGYA